jgi:hypothetical protein
VTRTLLVGCATLFALMGVVVSAVPIEEHANSNAPGLAASFRREIGDVPERIELAQ